jgi:hypothetical protein
MCGNVAESVGLLCAALCCALQQKWGQACPTTDLTTASVDIDPIIYINIKKGLYVPNTVTDAIQYSDLSGGSPSVPDKWGWDVPVPRLNTSAWTAQSNSGVVPSDFWSVMCESWGNAVQVQGNFAQCKQPNSAEDTLPEEQFLAGMVHVRYACNDTMWVLVYVFSNRGLSADTSMMWIRFEATTFFNAAGGKKSVQYGGTQSDGYCGEGTEPNCLGTEPANCTTNSCTICCNDMW